MMIPRTEYLNFFIRSKDKQLIKVVSGIRRCGKSTLFEMYIDYLLDHGVNQEQLIFINFEDLQYNNLRDYMRLFTFVMERVQPGRMNYVFLDEIQHVPEFERVVDSLFIQKNIDIYITGSNAYFMSSELATLLSGRYIELKMLPLSFKEYCSGTDIQKSISQKYLDYQMNSSFPYAISIMNNKQLVIDYLEGIFNTVILKDVVARNKIADVVMLEDVVKFLFHNIGNQTSTTKIANTMTSDGRKIDPKTVEKYIRALTESLIIYKAKRYNIKGKQYLKTLEKYYVVDIGLRYMLLGMSQTDVGHILENIVYLELIRRGYDVYVGQYGDMEVDFVAMNEQGIEYFQVAATVRDENVLNRELKPLLKINDHYPKYLLTLDEDPEGDYLGIRRMNALEYFLK
ncbi:MAG: ATP-binding protein [Bacillota bacterium]|nr:ATP-binding protein [Bacillota bacterium]